MTTWKYRKAEMEARRKMFTRKEHIQNTPLEAAAQPLYGVLFCLILLLCDTQAVPNVSYNNH
jgi:hypothetical protein